MKQSMCFVSSFHFVETLLTELSKTSNQHENISAFLIKMTIQFVKIHLSLPFFKWLSKKYSWNHYQIHPKIYLCHYLCAITPKIHIWFWHFNFHTFHVYEFDNAIRKKTRISIQKKGANDGLSLPRAVIRKLWTADAATSHGVLPLRFLKHGSAPRSTSIFTSLSCPTIAASAMQNKWL